ncbi:MAG: hypothetical protein EOO28_25350 [Comamonadaceae bacterium]|nr:MAG: hypothetical protein EOO28_25350 [Comamonadaceae bacterium]
MNVLAPARARAITITAPAETWAAAFSAWGRRLKALPSGVHPEWFEPLTPADTARARWQDLAAYLDIGSASQDDVADPVLRLALLDPAEMTRVLVFRALLARRGQVRLCIERSRQALYMSAVGEDAWRAVLADGYDAADPLGGDELPDLEVLAWEGYEHFARARQERPPSALSRLMRLQFPGQTVRGQHFRPDAGASRWILQRLGLTLKEAPPWCTCAGMNCALNWA